MKKLEPSNILMADDNPGDKMVMRECMDDSNLSKTIHTVGDREKLVHYLYEKRKYTARSTFRPGFILLNLNIPKIEGKETSKIIKSDRDVRRIPIIILTTSHAEWDITNTCDLGENLRFDHLIEIIRAKGNYWFGTVTLPLQ